jgi:putative N-acetylmannosamine-6-phosphate epimerase
MRVGDLVRHESGVVGQVFRIDKQHYGSNTAYKISKVERGKCIRSSDVDFIGTTAEGIQDRVLVLWECSDWEYVKSNEVEVLV